MKKNEEIWILKGYQTFALVGEVGLKVEHLSKQVGVSKSSFYHYFADLEIFVEKLLEHHLASSQIIAEKEKTANTINPELIAILIDHKIDLLFNRQLRINSIKPRYKSTLIKSTQIIGKDFVRLWLTDTNLKITPIQAESIYELALENFFLQINEENLSQVWLEQYFENLKSVTKNFESQLYGSV